MHSLQPLYDAIDQVLNTSLSDQEKKTIITHLLLLEADDHKQFLTLAQKEKDFLPDLAELLTEKTAALKTGDSQFLEHVREEQKLFFHKYLSVS